MDDARNAASERGAASPYEKEEEEDLGDDDLCGVCLYGDTEYWDARYLEEGPAAFDWYQRYSALRPLVRLFVPTSSRILMVGCGNSPMSEDMIKDGYLDIMNIDISSIVIKMMRMKYALTPQLKYMHMDVRDMSFFRGESFDCIIDKGTLDSLMCGIDAPFSASQMIEEVNRLLKCGGHFFLITYGDPSMRVSYLNQEGCNWKFSLYIIPRPEFPGHTSFIEGKSILLPAPLTKTGELPAGFAPEDPDSYYVYVCKKMDNVFPLEP